MNNLAKKVKNSGTGKMMHGTEKVVHTVDSSFNNESIYRAIHVNMGWEVGESC